MRNNADKPAHPMKPEVIGGNHQVYFGLTKREHFAGLAMQGLLANSVSGSHRRPHILCQDAWDYADQLLALEKS